MYANNGDLASPEENRRAREAGYRPGAKCLWTPKKSLKFSVGDLRSLGRNAYWYFDGPIEVELVWGGAYPYFDIIVDGIKRTCSAHYSRLKLLGKNESDKGNKELYFSPFSGKWV